LTFEYVSPISKAYRLVEVGAYTKTTQDLGPLVQIKGDIVDNFDADRIARGVAEANGMPLDWLRGSDSVATDRMTRDQANAGELAKQDAERLTEGASKLARAGIKPGTLAGLLARR